MLKSQVLSVVDLFRARHIIGVLWRLATSLIQKKLTSLDSSRQILLSSLKINPDLFVFIHETALDHSVMLLPGHTPRGPGLFCLHLNGPRLGFKSSCESSFLAE